LDGDNIIRYDSVYLTCSKKQTGSQLSLPHGDWVSVSLQCSHPPPTRFLMRIQFTFRILLLFTFRIFGMCVESTPSTVNLKIRKGTKKGH